LAVEGDGKIFKKVIPEMALLLVYTAVDISGVLKLL
jgi:hypothetical protein